MLHPHSSTSCKMLRGRSEQLTRLAGFGDYSHQLFSANRNLECVTSYSSTKSPNDILKSTQNNFDKFVEPKTDGSLQISVKQERHFYPSEAPCKENEEKLDDDENVKKVSAVKMIKDSLKSLQSFKLWHTYTSTNKDVQIISSNSESNGIKTTTPSDEFGSQDERGAPPIQNGTKDFANNEPHNCTITSNDECVFESTFAILSSSPKNTKDQDLKPSHKTKDISITEEKGIKTKNTSDDIEQPWVNKVEDYVHSASKGKEELLKTPWHRFAVWPTSLLMNSARKKTKFASSAKKPNIVVHEYNE